MNNKLVLNLKLISLNVMVCLGFVSFAQTTTVTLQPDESNSLDTYLSSIDPLSHATSTVILAYHNISQTPGSSETTQGLVSFNVQSQIGGGAQILSAELVFQVQNLYGSPEFKIHRVVKSSSPSIHWSESENSQSFSSNGYLVDASTAVIAPVSSGGSYDYVSFDVTDQVQDMYANPSNNMGWRIEDHASSYQIGQFGAQFFSSNASDPTTRPKLVIEVYHPEKPTIVTADVKSVTGQLCSADGSITLGEIYGGDGNYNYRWYNSSEQQIATGVSSISGLSAGWYGVRVTDYSGNESRRIFVVGNAYEETIIEIQPSGAWVRDAMVHGLDRSPCGGEDYTDDNWGDKTYLSLQRWNWCTWYNIQTLLDIPLMLDASQNLSQGELTLNGYSHNPQSMSNASRLYRATEAWHEGDGSAGSGVTWDSKPTYSSTPFTSIPGTSSSSDDFVIDVQDHLEYWQQNPTQNHGFFWDLENAGQNGYTKLFVYSSDATVAADRPKLTVTLKPDVDLQFADEDDNLTSNISIGKYDKIEVAFSLPEQITNQIELFLTGNNGTSTDPNSPDFDYYYTNFDNYNYLDYQGLNPYDPLDVDVEVTFEHEDGELVTVDAFYYVRFEYHDGANLVAGVDPTNPTSYSSVSGTRERSSQDYPWRARIAATKTGEWEISKIVVKYRTEDDENLKYSLPTPVMPYPCALEVTAPFLQSINCQVGAQSNPIKRKGFLNFADEDMYLTYQDQEISDEEKNFFGVAKQLIGGGGAAGVRYAACDNGDGMVTDRITQQYIWERLKESADEGANFFRLASMYTSWALENLHLGNYHENQRHSFAFDEMLKLCEDLGVHVNLDMEHYLMDPSKRAQGWWPRNERNPEIETVDCGWADFFDGDWPLETFSGNDPTVQVYWENSDEVNYYTFDGDIENQTGTWYPSIFTVCPYYTNSRWASDYSHPKNGCVDSPQEYYTDEVARQFARNRFRYMVSRWGYSPSIAVWQTQNELDLNLFDMLNNEKVNLYNIDPNTKSQIVHWQYEMAREIEAHDPHGRPTTMNEGSGYGKLVDEEAYVENTWANPDNPLDMISQHMYAPTLRMDAYFRARTIAVDMPFMYDEVGYKSGYKTKLVHGSPCSELVHQEELWSLVFTGGFSTVFPFWESYDHAENYGHVRQFVDDVDWSHIEKSLNSDIIQFAVHDSPIDDHLQNCELNGNMDAFGGSDIVLSDGADRVLCQALGIEDDQGGRIGMVGRLHHFDINWFNGYHVLTDDPSGTTFNDYFNLLIHPPLEYCEWAAICGGSLDVPGDILDVQPFFPQYTDVIGETMTIKGLVPSRKYTVHWYSLGANDGSAPGEITNLEETVIADCSGSATFVIPDIDLEACRNANTTPRQYDQNYDLFDPQDGYWVEENTGVWDATSGYAFRVEMECEQIHNDIGINVNPQNGIESYQDIVTTTNGDVFFVNENQEVTNTYMVGSMRYSDVDSDRPLASSATRLKFVNNSDGAQVFYVDDQNHLTRLTYNSLISKWEHDYIYNQGLPDIRTFTGIDVDPVTENIYFIDANGVVSSYWKSGGVYNHNYLNGNAPNAAVGSDLKCHNGKVFYQDVNGQVSVLEFNGGWQYSTISVPGVSYSIAPYSDIEVLSPTSLVFINDQGYLMSLWNDGVWHLDAIDYQNFEAASNSRLDYENGHIYVINDKDYPMRYVWKGSANWQREELSCSPLSYSGIGLKSAIAAFGTAVFYFDTDRELRAIWEDNCQPGSGLQSPVQNRVPLEELSKLEKEDVVEIGETKSLAVYPNPGSGRFTVKIGLDAQEKALIIVRDMTGRVVLRQEARSLIEGENHVQLKKLITTPGVYQVQVQYSDGSHQSERLIVE